MHVLLTLSGLLIVSFVSALSLRILVHVQEWPHRRDLQLFALAAPIVALAVAVGILQHFAGRPCFVGAPGWDYRLATALPLALALIALGAVALGMARIGLMYGLLARRGVPADAYVQARAASLSAELGIPPARVLVYKDDRPCAITYGLFRPTMLLSSWMVEQLDWRELESVLAHELAHIARRDYLVVWLAMILRDAFFYLPTSRIAFRRLQGEKELACDDLAVCTTGRPLALASALGKVWLRGPEMRVAALAQLLSGTGTSMETRIERLLNADPERGYNAGSRVLALGAGTAILVGLLVAQAMNVAVMLAPMGCGPGAGLI